MSRISLLRPAASTSNHSSASSSSSAIPAMPSAAAITNTAHHKATNKPGIALNNYNNLGRSNAKNKPPPQANHAHAFARASHAIFPSSPPPFSTNAGHVPAGQPAPIDMPRPDIPMNYCSSGSNHEPSSVCLAAMVHDFLEEDTESEDLYGNNIKVLDDHNAQRRSGRCGLPRCNCVDGVCSDVPDNDEPEHVTSPRHHSTAPRSASDDSAIPNCTQQLCEILEGVSTTSSSSHTKRPELMLLFDVAKAIEAETEELKCIVTNSDVDNDIKHDSDDADGSALFDNNRNDKNNNDNLMTRLRRPVMRHLRLQGYNAAVCKSRWNHRDGIPAGDYEYIDVILEPESRSSDDQPPKDSKSDRLIVDIDFRAQFEIARASPQYTQLLSVLPRIFVGRVERLKQILKIMYEAAKRSLKEQGLHIPPWRKLKYLQAKWFSAYRRTTNCDLNNYIGSQAASGEQRNQSNRTATNGNLRDNRIARNFDHHDVDWNRGLRLGGWRGNSAYRVFSTAFTKEMDMVFFNNTSGEAAARAAASNSRPAAGRARGSSRDVMTVVVCTDWELPELEVKRSTNTTAGKFNPSSQSNVITSDDGHRGPLVVPKTCSGLSRALKTIVSTNVVV